MRKTNQVEPEDLEKLLNWLDNDRNAAALRYEKIRVRLIAFFNCRGSFEPDFLADETIERVTLQVRKLADKYVGDSPELYFYGVARLVFHESLRQIKKSKSAIEEIAAAAKSNHKAKQSVEGFCLDECLQKLPPGQEEVFLKYYEDDSTPKKKLRLIMAEKFGINANALRVQIYRIKRTLQECVGECIDKKDM